MENKYRVTDLDIEELKALHKYELDATCSLASERIDLLERRLKLAIDAIEIVAAKNENSVEKLLNITLKTISEMK